MPRTRLTVLVLVLCLCLAAAPGLASMPFSAADLEGVWQWEADTGTGGAIAFQRQDGAALKIKAFTDFVIDDVYELRGQARVAADGGVEMTLHFMAEHHQNEFAVQNTCRGRFLAPDKIEFKVEMDYRSRDGNRNFSRT